MRRKITTKTEFHEFNLQTAARASIKLERSQNRLQTNFGNNGPSSGTPEVEVLDEDSNDHLKRKKNFIQTNINSIKDNKKSFLPRDSYSHKIGFGSSQIKDFRWTTTRNSIGTNY